jgi:hypothetical protein
VLLRVKPLPISSQNSQSRRGRGSSTLTAHPQKNGGAGVVIVTPEREELCSSLRLEIQDYEQ